MDSTDAAALATLANMVHSLAVVAVFLIIVMGPAWIIVTFIKSRAGRRLDTSDTAALQTTDRNMQRLEQRLATLEKILDAETPSWRGNFIETGDQYGRQAG